MRFDPARSPLPGITLRDALPSDEALLKRLYRSSRDPELELTDWPEERKAEFALTQFALQDRWYRENYPGLQMLVIEREGAPIGRLYLHGSQGLLDLMDITLEPAARAKGLGTALIQQLQRDAREEHAAITLHVESFNPARRLYARLGFSEEGQVGVYIRMRWKPR
jgi:GNAT superfamily N-acetyltransferase